MAVLGRPPPLLLAERDPATHVEPGGGRRATPPDVPALDSGSCLGGGVIDPQVMSPRARVYIRSRPCLPPTTAGELDECRPPADRFLRTLQVQFLLRFLDFLSVNMVLPTLPDYMERLGGRTKDYYRCLEAYALSFMLGTALLGAFVDSGPGRMLPSYMGSAGLIVAGNTLFSLAGSLPALRCPATVAFARCLVGLGASNAVLAMIFVTEVCEGRERQKWVIRFGITRSQGLFWGPTLGMALAATSTSKTGIWGADTVAGWFQALAVLAAMAALVSTWKSIPEEEVTPGRLRAEGMNGRCTFWRFLLQRRVLSVLLVMAVAATAQMACEVVIPVVCREALGWTGAASGSPLSAMAVLLTIGQLSLVQLTKAGMEDRTILLIGAALLPAVLVGTALLWLCCGPLDEVKVLLPFMAVALLGPFANLGSMAVFARLSMEEVPLHRGKCQAFQNNLLAMTNMAAPAFLSWGYSGERLVRERVPRSCIGLLGLLEVAALVALLCFWRELRPVEAQPAGVKVGSASAPLLPSRA